MWINAFLLALREIRRHLMRSFLTVLGIVIRGGRGRDDGHAWQWCHGDGL